MSKIFEALARLEHQGGGTLLPDLVTNDLGDPQPGGKPEDEAAATAASAGPSNRLASQEPEVLPKGQLDTRLIRTLPVRVPASEPILPYDDKVRDRSVSERYRIIRTKIIQHSQKPRLIVVSSPGPGDGKTVTALNLAGALSLKTTEGVLLVDADLRRASIHAVTGLPQTPGLADVLGRYRTLNEALIHTEQFPNLYVLPAGEHRANPAELLDSPEWLSLCKSVRTAFEYIVIDSPPVAAVADYDLIEAGCDGVVLVVRPDHTRRPICLKALEAVKKTKLLGVVMNCVEEWFLTKALHRDSYYQYYESGVQ
jgi:protein-tyrosine kinase